MYFSQTISKGSAQFARPGHTLAVWGSERSECTDHPYSHCQHSQCMEAEKDSYQTTKSCTS